MIDIPPAILRDARRFYAFWLTRMPRLDFDNTRLVSVMRFIGCPFQMFPIALLRRGLKARHATVRSRVLPTRMRIIAPRGRPKGIVVHFHGGGWTLGASACDDGLVAPMAAEGYVVMGVDYRLAPRSRMRDIIADCEAALLWILSEGARQFDLADVFLHGDSSGAHLALTSAIRCRSAAGFHFLKGMVLFCGCYDLAGTASLRSASRKTLILYGPSLPNFLEHVTGGLSEQERRDPAISPLYADLAGLPPTLLVVGSADPMRDDSRLLAAALRKKDVDVELVEVPDAPHGFNHLPIKLADFVNANARQWMHARTTRP